MNKIMLSRLPRTGDIWQVYATTSFMLQGWTLLVFFWELRGWAFFLTWDDLAGVLAYSMVVSQIESLLAVTVLLGLAVALPGRVLAEAFAVRGTLIAAATLGCLMFCLLQYGPSDSLSLNVMLGWLIAGVILGAALAYLSGKVQIFARLIGSFSDRMTVFLLLLIPLTLISLIVIVWRNLF